MSNPDTIMGLVRQAIAGFDSKPKGKKKVKATTGAMYAGGARSSAGNPAAGSRNTVGPAYASTPSYDEASPLVWKNGNLVHRDTGQILFRRA